MMDAFFNLAGFGMAAWDDRSISQEEPFTYHVTALPNYDRNLRSMCRKLAPTCVLAHIRGVPGAGDDVITESNLHPFIDAVHLIARGPQAADALPLRPLHRSVAPSRRAQPPADQPLRRFVGRRRDGLPRPAVII